MIRLYDEMSFPRPKNGTIWNTNRCHRCRRWFIFIFVTELTVVTVRVHVGWFDLRTSQLRTIPCFERLAQFIFVEWFIWKFKGDIISRFFPMSLRWTYVVPTDASSSFRVKQDHILLVYNIFVGSSGILGAGPPPSYFTFCASSPLMYKPVFLQQLTNYADNPFYPSQAFVHFTRGFGHQGEIRLRAYAYHIFLYFTQTLYIIKYWFRLKIVTSSKIKWTSVCFIPRVLCYIWTCVLCDVRRRAWCT